MDALEISDIQLGFLVRRGVGGTSQMQRAARTKAQAAAGHRHPHAGSTQGDAQPQTMCVDSAQQAFTPYKDPVEDVELQDQQLHKQYDTRTSAGSPFGSLSENPVLASFECPQGNPESDREIVVGTQESIVVEQASLCNVSLKDAMSVGGVGAGKGCDWTAAVDAGRVADAIRTSTLCASSEVTGPELENERGCGSSGQAINGESCNAEGGDSYKGLFSENVLDGGIHKDTTQLRSNPTGALWART